MTMMMMSTFIAYDPINLNAESAYICGKGELYWIQTWVCFTRLLAEHLTAGPDQLTKSTCACCEGIHSTRVAHLVCWNVQCCRYYVCLLFWVIIFCCVCVWVRESMCNSLGIHYVVFIIILLKKIFWFVTCFCFLFSWCTTQIWP